MQALPSHVNYTICFHRLLGSTGIPCQVPPSPLPPLREAPRSSRDAVLPSHLFSLFNKVLMFLRILLGAGTGIPPVNSLIMSETGSPGTPPVKAHTPCHCTAGGNSQQRKKQQSRRQKLVFLVIGGVYAHASFYPVKIQKPYTPPLVGNCWCPWSIRQCLVLRTKMYTPPGGENSETKICF